MSSAVSGGSSPFPPLDKINLESKEDLLKLLVYFEGELQSKEKEISSLKDEKARSILNQAKYGKLKMGDPMASLNRDGTIMREHIDESVLNVYEYQQRELERLCQLQKNNQEYFYQYVHDLEKRHIKILEEFERDKRRRNVVAHKHEFILNAMTDSRDMIAAQLEAKQLELDKVDKELDELRTKHETDRANQKLMITYLLTERKQLLLSLHAMKMKTNNQVGPIDTTGDSPLVRELKKDNVTLRAERKQLQKRVQQLETRTVELDKKLKIKEEDIATLRQNILAKARQQSEQGGRPATMGGMVVANKGAMTAGTLNRPNSMPLPQRTRLPNSSSFPATIPGTSSASAHSSKGQSTLSSAPMYKKFPTISSGISNSMLSRAGGGRGVPFLGTKASNLPIARPQSSQSQMTAKRHSPQEAVMDQVGMFIDSMSHRPQLGGAMAKRSVSLPRNSPQRPRTADGASLPSPAGSLIPMNSQKPPRTVPSTMPTGNALPRVPQSHARSTGAK